MKRSLIAFLFVLLVYISMVLVAFFSYEVITDTVPTKIQAVIALSFIIGMLKCNFLLPQYPSRLFREQVLMGMVFSGYKFFSRKDLDKRLANVLCRGSTIQLY